MLRYYILLITFIPFGCLGQIKDCKKFKTGTFRYVDKDYDGHIVVRNDSIQIESNDKDNIRVITSVEWISECEYILTYVDVENYPKKKDVIGNKIKVEIISTEDNKYKCHVLSEASDVILEFVKEND